MRHRDVLLVAAGFLLISSLAAAEVQWLQYRTSEHARDVVGGSSQFIQPEETALDSEKLPELNLSEPVCFKWQTKMDAAGFRWVILDKQHKHGLCDVLYIDSDGDGRIDDEQKVEGRQEGQYEVKFYQVPVTFEGEDGPITYHLNLRFYNYNERSIYLYAYTGCWYEGQVDIGGKSTRCVLVDYNCNGTFNDTSAGFDCDRILTGPEQQSHQNYVGKYLELDEKLYRLNIATDGAFVELKDASDVAYGTVTMPTTISKLRAGGVNGMFERTVKDGKVSLPEGKYRISSWEINRKDDNGAEWQLSGSGFREEKDFVVKKGTELSVDIGEPVFSNLEADFRDNAHYFNQQYRGKSGERISMTKNGRQIPAPKIHITDTTEQYDRTFTLEYG